MAIFEVKVPQLSESVAEATLLQWKKKVGDAVGQDEILIEIETDKVVLEVPAPSAGVLTEILITDGGTVVAEQLIAKIDSTAVASAAPAAAAPVATPAAPSTPVAAPPAAKNAAAAPSAAKLMAENNLSSGQVAGSGRDGRITKGDVIGAVAGGSKSVSLPSAPIPSGNRPEERVPMSRLRARIAERLLESQANNAILTTFNEVNMAPVIAMRNKYKDQFEKVHGVKLGFMSFFVKAATHALKKFPLLNASVDGNDIIYHGYFDIGIAVSSPRGLVVPILRDVDQMNLADIEKKIAEFGSKARDGKLSIEDLTGGTFSISNGGVFGSMLSTPIINPPQSAILGIHATKERAVVEDGQIVIRPINYLALSYDHRIIDGREAVLGLVAMKEALEDPSRLLLDL
ncbi:2-oxoglutarate dehydrogenase complex dihydrolipoyllysine-residue succinyltransferase [Polynucleobacter sp. Latsch14-2]|jgi:2-oxoglutarate dehydrogenase E2 component (dihydrolipoamide succinyltransferase)|uniref:2-oxoglutarate dehydrogenase complex dihydrolipoyllysine-residue succinyltransferase n=1 Tax=Polynucleobacter sp. Latsch14-2 TaxID=2576920 RepID=UPI001C0C52F9|nr:2-oxoglutarate dehydrogenase complex dihydrolipoyllysine-residue succinyltransferase [Polynucleobacter sp. Latsch14-2]MBU3614355.1 2-oxoglutarate dehydrogenase complex dihydrolipoyllysine-residue succinyltransferase [Polynucleobacter sp. Latsch14-2]